MDRVNVFAAGNQSRNQVMHQDVDQHSDQGDRRICQTCSEEPVGTDANGNPFVACGHCFFPVCRKCYEYERKGGSGRCLHCKQPYRRLKGTSRIEGDDEDSSGDDLESEYAVGYETPRRQSALHEVEPTGYGDSIDYPMLMNGPMSQLDTESVTGMSDYQNAMLIPQQHQQQHHIPGVDSHMKQQAVPFPGQEPNLTSMGSTKVDARPLVETAQLGGGYGYGSIAWDKMEEWKRQQDSKKDIKGPDGRGPGGPPDNKMMETSRQPLSRKVNLPSSKINPYRLIIIIRLIVMGFFLRYRLENPVKNAMPLWITSVVCELWFAVSWILDQFPKWLPINRETYLDRLAARHENNPNSPGLSAVDLFVSTVDPVKEPILITANTLLSILSVDYPVDKVSCYLSDDGGSFLTFEAMAETAEFARKWVPFAKKYEIEPRAPEWFFASKSANYLKDVVEQAYIKDRREMKRDYEEFKVRVNALVAQYENRPKDGWTMADDTPWPGNNSRDHPGLIQVFLGPGGGVDVEGSPLPRLVYVSREKRPGYNHHKKAGAMNALVRVSAVLTNAPYILNVDCDHYVNNSKALREAMCFMMDPHIGRKTCYVQFPQRFDGIDTHDRYANHNTVFFDINLRGLDGLQGPVYVGTGCCFRRLALYGNEAPVEEKSKRGHCCCGGGLLCCGCLKRKKVTKASKKLSAPDLAILSGEGTGIEDEECLLTQKGYKRKFGPSSVFVMSTFHEDGGNVASASANSTLKEAIHVISCGYEDNTDWGVELGWIYGSVTEDILTGFKMHTRGWRSIYCMPKLPAFKGSAPINLTDRLQQVLRWALGSVEIFLSHHCPIWYGWKGRLKGLQRFAYVNTVVYPWTAFPLVIYCCIPAVCLFTNRFIVPQIDSTAALWFLSMFISIFATGILEMRWSGVGMEEWWRNEQFWVIGGVSSHLYAVFQGLLKVLVGIDTNFTVTSKATDEDGDFAELYMFKYTSLLIPPTTLVVLNAVGVVVGLADAVNNGVDSWGPLFGKLLFAFWVIVHLYPFLKGLMGRSNRTPTLIVVWSVLLASIFSLLFVRLDPFLTPTKGPDLTQCGVRC